jgi:hypothetical protein
MLKSQSWKRATPSALGLMLQLMDDINFQFVYEIYPICKAEIAQLLQERSKGIEAGAYMMRQT